MNSEGRRAEDLFSAATAPRIGAARDDSLAGEFAPKKDRDRMTITTLT
jgi:hypothetical protein